MPNGGMREGQFEELERFFRPIATCLEQLAASHNLLIERYYHDAPMWSLRFAHPAGGSATIDVARAPGGSLAVTGTWWLDVYLEFTRYLRDTARYSCLAEPDAVTHVVRSTLSEILGWQPGAWSRIARDYREIWGRYSEDEFSGMGPHFPRPRP